MIIHITGQNGAGKTTLCEKLSKKLNIPYKHFDKVDSKEEGKKQYFDFLNNYNNENIILDRFHEGEWIYAPIYRNYTGDYLQEIEEKIKQFDYIMIFVTCKISIIEERLKIRGEDFLKPEHYQLELDNFNKFIKEQSLPYIVLDTSEKSSDESFNYALDYINKINKNHDKRI